MRSLPDLLRSSRYAIRSLSLYLCLAATALSAAPLTLNVTRSIHATIAAPTTENATPDTFAMGTATNPAGETLTVATRSLVLNGQPWTSVMGEFHYARFPADEWRAELTKMKAGGIDIVATYVFWIHHEEIEGTWEWAGDKDLTRFVRTAGEVGLKVIVRCGPWCHGEVRNGGLPDWVVARGNVRSDDPAYLASARKLYTQIAAKLTGLLWKDGGPVIGIQLDNEYGGPAQHLLTLKAMARDLGLDVPLYTRTGWPALKTPMPFGEIIPLYGVYAEGFWDRETTLMPGNYWAGFHFSTLRTDANIANEALGRRDAVDAPDVARYPYLTCEIGGGMMSSYHRRILVDSRDIESTTLVKLGSGSVSPGYYMYHGGTNPPGKLTTLMEEQATAITNWNDMPVKNYDFDAPLGQYGQIRPHYYMLRRLHYFLHDFGAALAGMDTFLPTQRPTGKNDLTTLRWSARADAQSGFVFVNNFERGRELPAKTGVQFQLNFADHGPVTFPTQPVTIPAHAYFIWPVKLPLAGGARLDWATAQLLCHTKTAHGDTYYFAETPGIAAEFVFSSARVVAKRGRMEGTARAFDVMPGRDAALIVNSNVRIVLLSTADSLALHHDAATDTVTFDDLTPRTPRTIAFEKTKSAGPLRQIELGNSKQPVAAAPLDPAFADAAEWRITIPADLDLATNPLLRLHYVGDVARVYLNGEFITDDYYNGNPLEIGLRRHATALKAAGNVLTLQILPLQKSAVTGDKPLIYVPRASFPDFANADSIADLRTVDVIPQR